MTVIIDEFQMLDYLSKELKRFTQIIEQLAELPATKSINIVAITNSTQLT
jgi:hypothetical protein